jgi:hypothetical protein
MSAGKITPANKSPKRRKLLRWAFGLLLFYTVVGFFILPPIIRAVAIKKLSAQLDREVSIQKVKLNPFALSTTIRGLMIKDKDGQPFVSWDEVYVNLQLASLFGHTWVFSEVSTTNPYVRVQVNKNYSLNFSDLITKFSTNTSSSAKTQTTKPLALRIDHLHIAHASASLTDLTPSTPFRRIVGPLDITLDNFRTDPNNKNPYSFSGTTDAGEKISWAGYFYLDPIRSRGELALNNFSLNKYAPLYQDFVRFEIKDGVIDLRSEYQFELSPTNRIAVATNASFALHSFKLAEPNSATNIIELPEFSVTGASGDAIARRGEINSISANGAKLILRRNKNAAINVVELSKPAETATNAPGGIILLLRSVTNVVAQLLNSTNAATGIIREVNFQNCAVSLADDVNSRPVRLDLDQISLTATNISNLPGTNLTASLALRWNTNGTIKVDTIASFAPTTADVDIALDKLELRPLDPYLESKLNVFVIDSKLGMNGHVHLRETTNAELPEVTFNGDTWLDDFSTVDGEFGEDLLRWNSVKISGIEANLNPQSVAIKEVAVNDAFARIVIETNRTINLLAALRITDTNAPEQAVEDKPAEKSSVKKKNFLTATNGIAMANVALPKISVATVVISNAQMRFTDRSLEPNVNVSVQQAGGTIAGLSTEQLQHADLNLHAKVDGIGPVEITGTINPFSDTSTNHIVVTAHDIDLTPESPYAGKFAGYRIAKGKLNLALGYELRGRQLKSTNLITLDQFTFGEKVNSPDATKLPVRLGVAILKDRRGQIVLDVPIEGSLDDPQFKLHKVIVRAIGNIITKVITSPFAALGAIFGGKGEDLDHQDFAPGSFALQSDGTNQLNTLVKALYERPGLQLEIEGSVDPATDRDGLRRAMLDKQLRVAKWQSLSPDERSSTPADQISLTPEERMMFEKTLFDVGVQNGKIQMPSVNAQATNASAAQVARATKRSSEPMKGATLLMQRSPSELLLATSSASPESAASNPIEQALLNNISVSDNDYLELASNRAKAVREFLLQSGKVESERIFLTENKSGGVKTNGSKVFLQLQ